MKKLRLLLVIMIIVSVFSNCCFTNVSAEVGDDPIIHTSVAKNINIEEAKKYPEIFVNTETTQGNVGQGRVIGYKFIPQINDIYIIEIETKVNYVAITLPIRAHLYDQDGNLIGQANTLSTYQKIVCRLEADKEYYLTYTGTATATTTYGIGTVLISRIGSPDDEEIITTDELWQTNEEISLDNITEILPGTEKKVNLTILGAKSVHKFIPDKSGEYIFTSTDNEYIVFGVRNEKLNYINSGKSPFVMNLEAGKCYVITSYISSETDDIVGEYTIKIRRKAIIGDLDEDEAVTAKDALLVLKHAARIELINDDSRADMNNDNRIDAEDALEILKIAANIK